ncbi:GCN5-related N-acetyltransferase [Pyrolobus fumarii 1A]|uniref:GCN5-related N-acetyltransferase n=2 Tax=Pyrolobus fumarii TaxID=54252 RepID=G0EE10_PYRF1|nr:GCN5-related N-acetyltransferase [Pyrolobus fumarii 1A]
MMRVVSMVVGSMRLEVVEAEGELKDFVRKLAYELFGSEGYWVEVGLEWDRRWVRTLVLLVDGEPVGFNQVYVWPCCDDKLMLGVHHYAGVRPEFQGRGYGKILIASGEEVLEELGAEVFAATLRADNTASRRMLESLGYDVMTWDDLRRKLGNEITEDILYVTGGYTDDLVALKTGCCPWRDPVEYIASKVGASARAYR